MKDILQNLWRLVKKGFYDGVVKAVVQLGGDIREEEKEN